MINLIEPGTRGLNASYIPDKNTSAFVSYWDTNSCPLVTLLYIEILQEIKAVRKSVNGTLSQKTVSLLSCSKRWALDIE